MSENAEKTIIEQFNEAFEVFLKDCKDKGIKPHAVLLIAVENQENQTQNYIELDICKRMKDSLNIARGLGYSLSAHRIEKYRKIYKATEFDHEA